MAIRDVFNDSSYRNLADELLRTAADTAHVEVGSVRFAPEGYGDDYAWLCFVVDPRADDHVAPITGSSAADHFALIDPLHFSANAGTRIEATIFELEVADEAPILVRGEDGEPALYSPWLANLAVAKAVFNYSRI